MALGYLLEPFIQVNTIVGTPVVGAKIYVYKGNTSVLATTYNDFEGHLNTNPVRTNTLGNCTIIADDSISYDIEIRDALGLLLMSKKNITIGNAASGSGELTVDAGYGIEVTRTQGSWKVSVDTDLIATQDDLAEKQDKLQAGANIEITNDNVVNVVNRREVVTEWPIKLECGNNRVKFYIDDDYANQFKSKQTPVEYGGAIGNYISYIAQNENGEIEATVQETVLPSFDDIHAGDNISITRTGNDLTISSKDWTNDITSAVSGKIDKVTGGAGSETNPVYLTSTNVVTPCFSNTNSVKLSPDNPFYFIGDAGGNVMLRATYQSNHLTDYSIKNSVFLGWQTDYALNMSTNPTKEHFDNCIFLNGYMFGDHTNETTPQTYSYNTIIGYNSIAFAKDQSNANTIIGQYNDFLKHNQEEHYFAENTFIGYQNNSFTDMQTCTVIGSNNDIGNTGSSEVNNKKVYDITIIGNSNDYTYDSTNASPYYGLLIGSNNNITSRQNYKTCAIGFDNSLTGNCTYLIGDSLTATNEGSYDDKIMKIGFGSCHLEIHSTGIIYKVVNGTKTQI